jgi:hypothetical protein
MRIPSTDQSSEITYPQHENAILDEGFGAAVLASQGESDCDRSTH